MPDFTTAITCINSWDIEFTIMCNSKAEVSMQIKHCVGSVFKISLVYKT